MMASWRVRQITDKSTQYVQSLRCYYNWFSKEGLAQPPCGWLAAIKDADYEGVQFVQPLDVSAVHEARALGLGVCGSGRVNEPADANRLAQEAAEAGLEALTLHVGWGYEEDHHASLLIESILRAAERTSVPLFVETHRATIFQDLWRAVQFVHRFPDLKFNGDFSHWYTGLEMVYGDFEKKLAFIQPVLQRVWFMHGRIGNPGCMQVNLGSIEEALERPYVEHFRRLWKAVFAGFFRRRELQSEFCFTVELLAPDIYYARTFAGREESDRWQQSLVVCEIAKQCFTEARMEAIPAVVAS